MPHSPLKNTPQASDNFSRLEVSANLTSPFIILALPAFHKILPFLPRPINHRSTFSSSIFWERFITDHELNKMFTRSSSRFSLSLIEEVIVVPEQKCGIKYMRGNSFMSPRRRIRLVEWKTYAFPGQPDAMEIKGA